MVKQNKILGILHTAIARFFKSIIVQFVLVGVIFWCFHWICPGINEYCKQNPGIPTTALWIRETGRNITEGLRRTKFDSFLIANVIWIIGVAFSTLFTLEVERIWMFMLPFILIPVGKHLAEYIEERKSHGMFYFAASLLWTQIIAFEVLLNTRW